MARASEPHPDIARFQRIVREHRGGSNFYVSLLGLYTFESREILEQVEAGFPFEVFSRLQQNLALQSEELADIVRISKRTLARRRETGQLTAVESDRLLRLARIIGKALALHEGDMAATRLWFSTSAPALAGRAPRDLSSTEAGAREVEDLIGRLEHGVFS